ncbi:TIGR00341 family protein [bacterium]|nr:TIGR00341 family protein [bacterium]
MSKSQSKVDISVERMGFLKASFKKLFRLTPKEREAIYTQILSNSEDTFPFYLLISLGSVVITLGLIINSGAVVIGGMLISPLLWPILAFSLSVTRGRVMAIQKSFLLILKGSLLVLFVAVLVGFISPLNIYSDEVLARTEPTLIELIIGICAGFIGAYSASSKKISSTIGGVAISVALVPPLCVAGLTLAAQSYEQSIGAFLLYVANLLAIIVSSVAVYTLEGYYTSVSSDKTKNIRKNYLAWSFTLLIFISLPLVALTKSLIKEQQVRNYVLQTTLDVFPNSKISDLSIYDSSLTAVIEYTLRKDSDLDPKLVERLTEIYSAQLKKPVTLNINYLQTQKVTSTGFSR